LRTILPSIDEPLTLSRPVSESEFCFPVVGEDEEEWQSEVEGEAPAAAVSGGEVPGDVTNSDTKTSTLSGQERDSLHPPPPRLRLKAGLATDPAVRAKVPSPVLPPTAPGLEYLAALNPAFHSGETKVHRVPTVLKELN
jgi:hypothetical protein